MMEWKSLAPEWIEGCVVLEIEAITEMERLARKHLERAIDVVGIGTADYVVAHRQRARGGEAVAHMARGPSGIQRRSSSAGLGRGPFAGGLLERPLVRKIPVRVEGDLWLIAGP